jgi:hypothetical protein
MARISNDMHLYYITLIEFPFSKINQKNQTLTNPAS